MNKAGGLIAVIGGVFGTLAAVATLFIGGTGAAFEAQGFAQMLNLGWSGIAASFLSIVFGSLALNITHWIPGMLLVLTGVGGFSFGGTLVAVCMALTIVGGLIALFPANEVEDENDETDIST